MNALRRVAIGALSLDKALKPGEFREITAQELTEISM